MSVLPAKPISRDAGVHTAEEIDVWWGSYAGRAMAPSFAVCIALTIAIYAVVRWWVPERGWLQLTFFGLAGAVWLVQLVRWSNRFFTWNYRLTTCFLYVDRGLRKLLAQRIPLTAIGRVEVRCNWMESCLGIGDLWVEFDGMGKPPIVLKALRNPRAVAETMRDLVKKASENPC